MDDFEFEEFARAIRADIADHASSDLQETRRISRFTEFFVSSLADFGIIDDAETCYLNKPTGRGNAVCNGWHLDPVEGRLDLFTTIFQDTDEARNIQKAEVEKAAKQAVRVYDLAVSDRVEEVDPAHREEYDLLHSIRSAQDEITQIRVFILTDGQFKNWSDQKLDHGSGLPVHVGFWDVSRLFKIRMSGREYEPIEIDLVERFGSPISCLQMPASNDEYKAYLAILPGDLLAKLYDEFGSRLMELNVRSFLQQRGKVNQGIRDTIRHAPTRFLAYNNGLSATVESIDLSRLESGDLAINKMVGFQIVNGGQTVASIHRAMKADKCPHLDQIAVQAKISVVRPELLDELVPLISRYSNTQNTVNEADFSSNDPFHVRIERLAETVWAPGEQVRWFYERARGQYEVARARQGSTPAKRKVFDVQMPKSNKFTKTDLAKYLNSWDENPHIVSQGAQKNFVWYMTRLYEKDANFEPDESFYKDLISKAIIFKHAEKVARQHKFPAYRANAITYTVALLAFKTTGRLTLGRIWDEQVLSEPVAQTIYDWMPTVWQAIVDGAGDRNVTEWAKKEECWSQIQLLDLAMSSDLESRLTDGDPLPNVGRAAKKGTIELTREDRENLARVMRVKKEDWRAISDWGQETGNLQPWQHGIALTLSGYAAGGWKKVPSVKQARQAVKMLQIARDAELIR